MNFSLLDPRITPAARDIDPASDDAWLGAEAMIAPSWLRELERSTPSTASSGAPETDWCAL
ncbi:MAG: hypothetical protein F9K31_09620 [Dokdonella sp.]|nr:MAG: hypothetical protein F9K31_09620 [Dokdonella sp.]